MTPPDFLQILHLRFEFRLVDEVFFDASNAYGFCDKKHLVITVLKTLRPALLADSALHEAIHGIHFAMGCADQMDEETIAMQLAGPLCMVIRDNPQFVAWIQYLLAPQ